MEITSLLVMLQWIRIRKIAQQKTALETIKDTIKGEIEVKRAIYNINGQSYSDCSSENKIEEKITIKIDKDGKVSLLGVDKVTQFKSKEYLNQKEGEGKKLTEADADAFKKLIEEHIKGIKATEVKSAINEYPKIIEKLQGLNLTSEKKEE